jgi:hypothetical protein
MVNGVVRRVLAAGREVDSGKNVTVEAERFPMSESFAWLSARDGEEGHSGGGEAVSRAKNCGTERKARC